MGRIKTERKREIEKELEEMAIKLRGICEELEASIHLDGTYYSWRKGLNYESFAGAEVVRFFEGYKDPGLITRKIEEQRFRGLLSERPRGRKEK